MLQNLATNTFLPDRVFSGWFLSITSGSQDSRLAKGKGEGLGESMKPLPPKHKLVFKFFPSSHFPRANLEAVDIHLPYTPTFFFFFCFCHQIFKVFSLCKTTAVIFLLLVARSQTLGYHLGVIHIGDHQTKDERLGQGRVLSPGGATVSLRKSSSNKSFVSLTAQEPMYEKWCSWAVPQLPWYRSGAGWW